MTIDQEPTDLALLNGMHHAVGAGHRSENRQGCLKGTGKGILGQAECWSMDERDQRVFWLNGLPGTGKSTISQTLAEVSFADGRLGASFFCSRHFEDRRNLHTIFPTLAFELAHRYPPFRDRLLQVLRMSPDVRQESLCSQMEKLLVGPLKTTRISTLMIIDGLDECEGEVFIIPSILSQYVDQIPNVKFFITGWAGLQTPSGFRLATLQPITEIFKLHNIESFLLGSDIRLFFRTQLANIAKVQNCCPSEDWPSSSDLDILCDKAAGWFIYASMAIKFIESKDHPLAERLNFITSLPQSTIKEGQSGVGDLYIQVLEQAFHSVLVDGKGSYSRFRSVLGVVLLMFNPLSLEALSVLLRVSGVPTTLHSLHSLLIPNSRADPVLVFHQSLLDFLTDPGHCKDGRFYINPSVHHEEILLSCLDLMKGGLKKNICDLDDYSSLDQVDDLSARRKAWIGDALEYACLFWAKHLARIPSNSGGVEEVHRVINEFFMTHFLFWIEALIVMRNLNAGIYAIDNIQQWYASVSHQQFVLQSLS